MRRPLEGLKVLELARILAGPWAGQILADLGADVIKVEAPEGDDIRGWGPPFVEAKDGGTLSSAYFHSCNRGKRSVIANFRSDDDLAMVRALARNADVIIENFKVGGLAKFGLDEAAIRIINPTIIYCSITGFGQDGPYAPRPGYDFIIQGMGGIMDITGETDGPPMKIGVAYADMTTGLYAVIAILAALNRRNATGEGGYCDMALLDTQAGMLQAAAMNYLVSGKTPKRMGNAHPNLCPYQLMPVKDGHLILAVGNDAQFRRACAVLGCADLGADPLYATNADRLNNRDRLMATLADHTRRFTKADLSDRLEAAGVPAGPINDIADVYADPQVVHRQMVMALAAPEAAKGVIPTVRTPIILDGVKQVSSAASPRLGSDNEPIRAAAQKDVWPHR